MNRKDLFTLYRDLYFHEMEVKEKIVVRTQIIFAILVTAFTVISYMLRMVDQDSSLCPLLAFYFFIALSILFLMISVRYLIYAFSGDSYKGMSSPAKTDEYRVQLITHIDSLEKYNEENPDNHQDIYSVDEKLEEYLYNNFRDCSSHNTDVNDARSGYAHDGFKWILTALVPLTLASGVFIIDDLDVSSPRKELLIKNESLVVEIHKIKIELQKLNKLTENKKIEEITMSSEPKNVSPPPPMPAAPEPRNIKGETPIKQK